MSILDDDAVRHQLRRAWRESEPGTASAHEEGGFVLKTETGELIVERWPKGTQDEVTVPNHSGGRRAGFSAYGEADDQLVDVLGIAPGHQWFLACEFKVLDGAKKLHELMSDVEKLRSFWIRCEYPASKYGAQYSDVLARCEAGFGLVGGLHAAKRDSSNILDIWSNPDRLASGIKYASTAARLNGLGTEFPTPAHVVDFPTGWRYYLLVAVFPISRPG